MCVLYSDDHVIVAKKPRGVLSQKDEKGRENMVSILEKEFSCEIFPVHRLDKETAGVMVFAKTPFAAAALSDNFRENKIQKEYFAVLHQKPEKEEGSFEDLLFFDRQKNKVFPVKRERKGVKKASLSYRREGEKDGVFLVRVFPKTGRTHQIRVQFASRKMPLYGDKKYGGKGEGLGLFCASLTFSHPKTKEEMQFSALPEKESPWDLFFPENIENEI